MQIVSGIIYALHNGDHNYRYIGLTSKTTEQRLKGHIDTAKYNPTKNIHKTRWILKNEGSIFIEVLEYYSDIPLKDLHKREMVCIAKARIEGWNLLNATDGGEGTPGAKISDEARAAISARQLGVKLGPRPDDVRRKISESRKGYITPPEVKEKIRQSRLGSKHSEEHKKNISNGLKGNVVTEETRAKISKARTGIQFSDEHRNNIAKANHRTHHVNKNKIKDGCKFCAEVLV